MQSRRRRPSSIPYAHKIIVNVSEIQPIMENVTIRFLLLRICVFSLQKKRGKREEETYDLQKVEDVVRYMT